MRKIHSFFVSLDRWLAWPALWLSVVWLITLIIELVHGSTPTLFAVGTMLWAAFLLIFLLKFWLAPRRLEFLGQNWLFELALAVPILRLLNLQYEFRWVNYLTATSATQLIWVMGSVNLSMRSIRQHLARRRVGLVGVFTLLVIIAGGAAMYNFEHSQLGPGLHSYPEAMWWTAMQLTTIGSGYTPVTPEGQIVCLGVSLFGCGAFGYLTATIATFFIGQDAVAPGSGPATQASVEDLRKEIQALRQEMKSLQSIRRP